MKSKFPDLACAKCGSNRFKFPKSAADAVKCEDCDHPVASLKELQERIVRGNGGRESRADRVKRHSREAADSHRQLRASVAETDRLVVASDDMLKRHRKEDHEAGD